MISIDIYQYHRVMTAKQSICNPRELFLNGSSDKMDIKQVFQIFYYMVILNYGETRNLF